MARRLASIGPVEAHQQRCAARKRTRPTRPTTVRPRLLGTFIVISATLLVLALLAPGGALAVSTNTKSVGANTLSTSSMAAPTSLTATVTNNSVVLNWTATATAYATGTQVLRSTTSGSGYAQIAQVTPHDGNVHGHAWRRDVLLRRQVVLSELAERYRQRGLDSDPGDHVPRGGVRERRLR